MEKTSSITRKPIVSSTFFVHAIKQISVDVARKNPALIALFEDFFKDRQHQRSFTSTIQLCVEESSTAQVDSDPEE